MKYSRPDKSLGLFIRRATALLLVSLWSQVLHAQAIPVLKFYPEDPSKTLTLNLTYFDNGSVIHNSSAVSMRPAAGYTDSPEDFRVQIFDVYNAQTQDFTLPDRLVTRNYTAGGSHVQLRLPSITSVLRVPFTPDAERMIMRDERTQVDVLEVNLKPTIHDFCSSHLADPECFEADLEVLDAEIVDQPPLVLFGESANLLIRTQLINHGPESPAGGVDAVFNQTVAPASPGISFSPTAVANVEAFDLLIGVPRTIDQVYSVTCLEPGLHEATVSSSIAPLSAAVIDLVAANDVHEFTVSIDCAIPVTINNKPGSFPNSTNTRAGSLPMAVLTTDVGEYGNPLAVDAGTIDVSTVTFGEPALAANGQGAAEKHGKKHLKNSWELDEQTRDQDLDAVMHFPVPATGLSVGDSEACVRGKLLYNNNPVTFFGCDSVNVVN